MKDEQLRILKTMHEATTRMDMNMFAQAVNLTPNQTVTEMQELVKEGFLQKTDKGYRLTEKAKNALKTTMAVAPEKSFHFYVGIDKPLGFSAQSLEEFYRVVRQVCSDALNFHLYRGDFENWMSDVIMDSELAIELSRIKAVEVHGEDLRKALLKTIDAKYGIGERN